MYWASVALLVAIGLCTALPEVWDAVVDTFAIPRYYTEWHNQLPARPLPLRKRDLERYPRAGFRLALDRHDFRLDTVAGTLTRKGFYEQPETTIAMRLSDAQLDTVYAAVMSMRLFDITMPRPPFIPYDSTQWGTRLTVRAGGTTRRLQRGESDQVVLLSRLVPDDVKRFNGLIATIDRMVRSDSAFRALPRPKVVRI